CYRMPMRPIWMPIALVSPHSANWHSCQGYRTSSSISLRCELTTQVIAFLQRQSVIQGEMEPSLLVALRQWIDPLPDNSIPNLRIREVVLRALERMSLDQDMLAMTGIGKPVMFLRRHPQETVPNQRLCDRLVAKWSAPIFSAERSSQKAPLLATP